MTSSSSAVGHHRRARRARCGRRSAQFGDAPRGAASNEAITLPSSLELLGVGVGVGDRDRRRALWKRWPKRLAARRSSPSAVTGTHLVRRAARPAGAPGARTAPSSRRRRAGSSSPSGSAASAMRLVERRLQALDAARCPG
ncbi:MAG: hypothetical protein MZW92_08565 [Comamonadaceae bacterium]|nr:hypothetical protein [Comamonadaceae bacterium]